MSDQPKGELALRTLAMPANTNANGDIFGGWLVSLMDLGGEITGQKLANTRVVTASIDNLRFMAPVEVGDTICVHVDIVKVGRTSVTMQTQGWVSRMGVDERFQATEGTFVFVAIDKDGKPTPVK